MNIGQIVGITIITVVMTCNYIRRVMIVVTIHSPVRNYQPQQGFEIAHLKQGHTQCHKP